MQQLRIGDITIDAVIERAGPWRRPQVNTSFNVRG